MRRPMALALLLLPVLVIGGWLFTLDGERADSPSLRVAIRGFDPRDLLRGHYLQFQLDLRGDPGWTMAVPVFPEGAVCLIPDESTPLRPVAAPMTRGCRYPAASAQRVYRYYLPQETALDVERILRTSDADRAAVTVLVHFAPDGELSFSDIQIEWENP